MKKSLKKRLIILFCVMMMLVVAAGCGKKEEKEEIIPEPEIITEVSGREVVIDTVNKTITDSDYIYRYYVYSDSIHISYPNGYSYDEKSEVKGGGVGDLIQDTHPGQNYSTLVKEYEEKYIPGNKLVYELSQYYDVSQDGNSKSEDDKNEKQDKFGVAILVFVVIVMFIGGILLVANPEAEWERKYGRHITNADPTDESINRIRRAGWFLVIASIGFAIWVVIRFF